MYVSVLYKNHSNAPTFSRPSSSSRPSSASRQRPTTGPTSRKPAPSSASGGGDSSAANARPPPPRIHLPGQDQTDSAEIENKNNSNNAQVWNCPSRSKYVRIILRYRNVFSRLRSVSLMLRNGESFKATWNQLGLHLNTKLSGKCMTEIRLKRQKSSKHSNRTQSNLFIPFVCYTCTAFRYISDMIDSY